jgi:hypothetical protein
LSAGSVERGVSRKEFGVANCQREAAAHTIAIRHTPYRHGDDSPGGTFQATLRRVGGSNAEVRRLGPIQLLTPGSKLSRSCPTASYAAPLEAI